MAKALVLSFTIMLLMGCSTANKKQVINPGEIWLDTDGNPINAHGAGILFDKGIYYWYGEYKEGPTWKVEHIDTWECYRIDAKGRGW